MFSFNVAPVKCTKFNSISNLIIYKMKCRQKVELVIYDLSTLKNVLGAVGARILQTKIWIKIGSSPQHPVKRCANLLLRKHNPLAATEIQLMCIVRME